MFLDEYPPTPFLQNQTGHSHAINVKQQQKFSLGSSSITFATTIQPIWVRGYDVHVSAPYNIIETIRPDQIVYTNDNDHICRRRPVYRRVDACTEYACRSTRRQSTRAASLCMQATCSREYLI